MSRFPKSVHKLSWSHLENSDSRHSWFYISKWQETLFTAKNAQVVSGWWKQDWIMLCCTPRTCLLSNCSNLLKPNKLTQLDNNRVRGVQHSIIQFCLYQPGTIWSDFTRVHAVFCRLPDWSLQKEKISNVLSPCLCYLTKIETPFFLF